MLDLVLEVEVEGLVLDASFPTELQVGQPWCEVLEPAEVAHRRCSHDL